MAFRIPKPLTGRHVLAIIVAFFLVIFAVNGVFLYVSLRSHPGVTTEDAYRKGIGYNRELEEADRQHALGWKATVAVENGAISIRLTDADGAPLHGVRVTVDCRRPTHDGEDRTFRLREYDAGLYRAKDAVLPTGRWVLRFDIVDADDKRLRVEEPVTVRP
mgnify:CR=1 FL=1